LYFYWRFRALQRLKIGVRNEKFNTLDACLDHLAGARLFAVETGGRQCYSEAAFQPGDAFLFGPETRGLPQAVLDRVGSNSLFIPMRAHSRSINLSNAVALVAYEAWRQLAFGGAATGNPSSG